MPQPMDVIDLERSSGLRPFDWLHRACLLLLEGRGRKYLREEHLRDVAIREYHLFLKLRNYRELGARLPLHYNHVGRLFKKYEMAYLLQFDAQYQSLRSELRARILADQPCEDIVRATGLSMHIVATYERFYFDVRECLNAKCYILGMLGAPPIPGREIDELQRLAYCGGIRVFEVVLLATRSQEPQWQDSLMIQIVAQLQDDERLRHLLAGSQPAAISLRAILKSLLGPPGENKLSALTGAEPVHPVSQIMSEFTQQWSPPADQLDSAIGSSVGNANGASPTGAKQVA